MTDIRTADDAHVVFEAVRLGIKPMIRRRLSPNERDLLQSGEVFVWEEADYKGGLERWTDGRKWWVAVPIFKRPVLRKLNSFSHYRGASRMREPFLFYEEKALPTQEEREAKAARRYAQSSVLYLTHKLTFAPTALASLPTHTYLIPPPSNARSARRSMMVSLSRPIPPGFGSQVPHNRKSGILP